MNGCGWRRMGLYDHSSVGGHGENKKGPRRVINGCAWTCFGTRGTSTNRLHNRESRGGRGECVGGIRCADGHREEGMDMHKEVVKKTHKMIGKLSPNKQTNMLPNTAPKWQTKQHSEIRPKT